MKHTIIHITVFEITDSINSYVRDICKKSSVFFFVRDHISLTKKDIIDIGSKDNEDIKLLTEHSIWQHLPLFIYEVGLQSAIENEVATTITTRYYCAPIMTQVEFENALSHKNRSI